MQLIKVIALCSLFISPTVMAEDCVILLHGMARSNSSMAAMADELTAAGYATVNYDYPSTDYPIEQLAEQSINNALELCPNQARINFVTHSLGGILVRQYLSQHNIERLGRVVMLGPPNQGSEVVDVLHDVPGYDLINGPAGQQLGTDAMSIPNQLGPANFELGIIAGSRSINLILSTMLPDTDDGKVSVEKTKLAGMKDHLILPVTHPFMMKNKTVIAQVKHFLKHGYFKKQVS
ncbi:alpha/beta hydrolase [Methylophaga sp. 41_12_T18]|nr:alpha/beta hydrolase [Methylophaga sp. 41_12_T18]